MEPEQPTADAGHGRRKRYRAGGVAMMVVGSGACFVVPFVGVPLLLLGIVVTAAGFLMS